jgi:hypothetical protein
VCTHTRPCCTYDTRTVGVSALPIIKKNIYQQILKLGANEASAKGYQNTIWNECHTNFLMKLWAFENLQFCIATVWRQVVQQNPIQITYRHLPICLRIPVEKKTFFFFRCNSKIDLRGSRRNYTTRAELEPWSPIFEKCSHLRDKGGVLMLRTLVGFALTPTCTV